MSEAAFVAVPGAGLIENVRHSSDPFGVRGKEMRALPEFWHLQCQPRVNPKQLWAARKSFFSFYRDER